MTWDWRQMLKHKGRTIAGGGGWNLGSSRAWQPDPAQERRHSDEAEQRQTMERVSAWFDRREAQRAAGRAALEAAHERHLDELAHASELARIEAQVGVSE
jgi:hypothetical protein